MFYRPFTSVLCLLVLSGCPSLTDNPDPAKNVPIPKLEIAYSGSMPWPLSFKEFSEDGSTFIAGNEYAGVGLYRSSDFTQLERYYERDKSHPRYPRYKDDPGVPTATILAFGYIDANTWYFVGVTSIPKSPDNYTNVHIRTIHPSREVAQYTFEGRGNIAVNKNYITYSVRGDGGALIDLRTGERHEEGGVSEFIPNWDISTLPVDKWIGGILVNWHTGERYPVKTINAARGVVHFELTQSNRVLLTGMTLQETSLDDPLHQETQLLDNYVQFSPDERYAVDWSGKRCKLRKFSGRKVTPLHEQEIAGYCSGRHWGEYEHERVLFTHNSQSFAVADNQNVRVYNVEPFQLVFEEKMRGSVVDVALSDDGWLAASDDKGLLHLWDTSTGQLVGQEDFSKNVPWKYEIKLAIKPQKGELIAIGDDIRVFKLPKRAAQ